MAQDEDQRNEEDTDIMRDLPDEQTEDLQGDFGQSEQEDTR